MASKVNYFKIGLFVIASILVLLIFVIALGAGSFGKKTIRFETYIDESVHGLTVGSAVKHRGVDVGRIEEITFVNRRYDLGEDSIDYSRFVLVVIAAEEKKFFGANTEETYRRIDKLIERGLRVRLTTQALTGMSHIETDYFDPKEYPPMEISWTPQYKYIPSTQSVLNVFTQSIDQTLKKIESVDFVAISQNMNTLLTTLNDTLQEANISLLSQNLLTLVSELRATNEDVGGLIQLANEKVVGFDSKSISDKAETMLDNFGKTAITLENLLEDVKDTNTLVQDVLKPNSPDKTTIPELLATVEVMAKSIEEFVFEFRGIVRENRNDVEDIIDKLGKLSDNLTEFSGDIKKDPGLLLFGDKPPISEIVK